MRSREGQTLRSARKRRHRRQADYESPQHEAMPRWITNHEAVAGGLSRRLDTPARHSMRRRQGSMSILGSNLPWFLVSIWACRPAKRIRRCHGVTGVRGNAIRSGRTVSAATRARRTPTPESPG